MEQNVSRRMAAGQPDDQLSGSLHDPAGKIDKGESNRQIPIVRTLFAVAHPVGNKTDLCPLLACIHPLAIDCITDTITKDLK